MAQRDLLPKIRQFKEANTPQGAKDLSRQLSQLEDNTGDAVAKLDLLKMRRLQRRGVVVTSTISATIGAGGFMIADTGKGEVNISLEVPKADDAGSFLVVIDRAGGASNLFLRASGSSRIDNTDHKTILNYLTVVFCDGEDYWSVL